SPHLTEAGVLYAVDLKGRRRVVAALPGIFLVEALAPGGKALLGRFRFRNGLVGMAPGETIERDLAWVELTGGPLLLSHDGALCVFNGVSEGREPVCYMRQMDGSPAVRLTTGLASSLSPDNKWILVRRRGEKLQLFLVPT